MLAINLQNGQEIGDLESQKPVAGLYNIRDVTDSNIPYGGIDNIYEDAVWGCVY